MADITTRSSEYFHGIDDVRFEGEGSANPLAFRFYDKDRVVLGRRMEEWLRPAVCYWHSFCWDGTDMFGAASFGRPWLAGPMTREAAFAKMDAAFDFFARLGLPFYCFHDVDVMPAAATLGEHARYFAEAVDRLERKQAEIGVRPLWGTANLFSHRRYQAGASTNPDPDVVAFAAAQVRQCLEATKRLGGENYVLWGGREGYDTLLNTDLKRELEQMGRFLTLVVDHKHRIGLPGHILIEPKPHEPTKHQYDFDTQTVYGFLLKFGLEKDVKVNIEANHATLAGHSFEHEVAMAATLGILGSIDVNRGDAQNGWDTDQFHTDPLDLLLTMRRIVQAGGLGSGGFNFDAKVRRQSIEAVDLFHGHVGGVDQLARALLGVEALAADGRVDRFVEERYAGWRGTRGQAFFAEDATLAAIADAAIADDVDPPPRSGRQEYLENVVNRYV
jgi:xylose isomerase